MQGGMGDFTNELGKALTALGIEVHVVTSVQGQGFALRLRPEGSALRGSSVRLRLRPEAQPEGLNAEGPKGIRDKGQEVSVSVHPVIKHWGWSSWRPILDIARRKGFNILNIQYQAAAYGMHPAINFLPLRLRLWKVRPKVVITFHDLRVPYLFPKAGPARRWVLAALMRWGDAVIVTNREDELEAKGYSVGADPYLIPIGSNIPPELPSGYNREEWRARWGVNQGGILLSYFGFLNESKGGEVLIQALNRLVKGGCNIYLLMVGGKVGSSDPTNVAYAQRLEALIDELGLGDRVLWTGYTEAREVSANLVASDICVLPYRDGASFRRGSFMAALVHGLPIVSTQPRVPLPELVDGRNIVLVTPDDAEALADKIADLTESAEWRERLGAGARELSQAFRWDGIAERSLEVYHALSSG